MAEKTQGHREIFKPSKETLLILREGFIVFLASLILTTTFYFESGCMELMGACGDSKSCGPVNWPALQAFNPYEQLKPVTYPMTHLGAILARSAFVTFVYMILRWVTPLRGWLEVSGKRKIFFYLAIGGLMFIAYHLILWEIMKRTTIIPLEDILLCY